MCPKENLNLLRSKQYLNLIPSLNIYFVDIYFLQIVNDVKLKKNNVPRVNYYKCSYYGVLFCCKQVAVLNVVIWNFKSESLLHFQELCQCRPGEGNCSCCKECMLCLGTLWDECCDCVGKLMLCFLIFPITESLTLRDFKQYKCILCAQTRVCIRYCRCIEHHCICLYRIVFTYICVCIFIEKVWEECEIRVEEQVEVFFFTLYF